MSLLRLRLSFAQTPADHPRHCYFLVDTSHCRVVADLAFLIAERFDLLLTKGHGLRLSIDGYALLPGEDIRVVRDNDLVRVSEGVTQSRGAVYKSHKRKSLKFDGSDNHAVPSGDHTAGTRKKVKRPTKGDQLQCKGSSMQSRQKASRKSSLLRKSESPSVAARRSKVKLPFVAKSQARADGDLSSTSTDSTSTSSDSGRAASRTKGKPTKSSSSSSPSDSSSSDEGQTSAVSNTKQSTVQAKQSTPQAVNVSLPAKTVVSSKKTPIRTVGTSSNSTGTVGGNGTASTAVGGNGTASTAVGGNGTASRNHVHFDSDGEVVDESCSIPVLPVPSNTLSKPKSGGGYRRAPVIQPVGRGRGQVCPSSNGPVSGPPQVGRSRVVGGPHDVLTVERQLLSHQLHTAVSVSSPAVTSMPSSSSPSSPAHPPELSSSANSKLAPESTACSFALSAQRNGGPGQDAELRDYSQFPKLQGCPRTGDVIAYKVLELSANYLPQISAFKEGQVLAVDTDEGSVTVKLRPECLPPPRGEDDAPGKFELIFSDDENDSPEPTDQVTILLSNMQDTKLVQS